MMNMMYKYVITMRLQKKRIKKTSTKWMIIFNMVGKTGFEPATSWSQTTCTTKLCYFPKKQYDYIIGLNKVQAFFNILCDTLKKFTLFPFFIISGALEGIRTPDLLVRSQTLYPAELRAQ